MPYWTAAGDQALWSERFPVLSGISTGLADDLAAEAEALILTEVGGMGALASDQPGFDAAMKRAVGTQIVYLLERPDPRTALESRGSQSRATRRGDPVDPQALLHLRPFRRAYRLRFVP